MNDSTLPTGWRHVPIGAVCKVVPGFAFKSKDWCDQGIPVVKIKNIKSDRTIDVAEVDHVPETIYTPKLKKFLLNDGDILIAMTGATAGKVGRLRTDRPLLLNQRAARFDPIDVDRRFFWAVVSSEEYERRFFHLADGAAQPNMSGSQIEGIDIPLPPPPIQRHIASILSAYDDLIENNTRRIALLEEMARRLYEEWFVHFRFPGHEDVKMVESEIGQVPEGWGLQRVKSIVKRLKAGTTYKQDDISDVGETIVIDQSTSDQLGFHDNAPDHIAAPDDPIIIFGDHTCKMQIMVSPFSLGPNTVPFVSADDTSVYYVYLLVDGAVETKEYKRHWTELSGKVVAKSPSGLTIMLEETVKPMFQETELLLRQNRNLRTQRDLLLPKLVSGEIDVSEVGEQMAEAAAE